MNSPMRHAARGMAVVAVLALGAGSAFAQGAKRDIEIKPQTTPELEAPERRTTDADRKKPSLGGEQFVRKSTEVMAEEKWQEAFRLLKKVIEATPDSDPAKPELYFRLSEMYWERSAAMTIRAFDNETACIERAKGNKALEAGCASEKNKLLAASARYREDAINVYRDIVRNFPTYPRLDAVLFALAYNYQQKNEPDNAQKIYVELIRRYPASEYMAETLLNVGEILFEAGQVEQALKAYQKVTTSYRESDVYGYALYKLGWCFYNVGDYRQALGQFVKVVEHTNQARGPAAARLSLKKEALRDLVRTYVHIEEANPSKSIDFFKRIAPDDYLQLIENLADLYGITGQFEKSNRLYRDLIALQPRSYKVIKYQKAIAYNTRNMGNQVETVKEVKRLVNLWRTVKDAKDADPKQVATDKVGFEELLRSLAVTFHRQALTTKSDVDYAITYELYKDYVETFPEGENSYTMTFYYGELLYRLQKWEEAASAYERALELNPQGEFTADAAHATVLSYKKLLDIKQDRGTGQVDELESKEGDAGPPPPKPLPETYVRFIKACDLYSKYVKQSDYLIDIEYDAARIYYDYNQFDEAIPRFKNISEKHAQHRLSVFAANLLLDAYNLKKDFDALEKQVDTFLAIYTPQRDAEFHGLLTRLKQQSSFKKCQGIEGQREYLKAAQCFRSYAQRFPDSEFVDKAYYNAALNFDREKRVEDAIEVRVELVNKASRSDLTPKALYRIGLNLQELAIYSQASEIYEAYASQFPKGEDAKTAQRNAAVFRQGLQEYDKALANYAGYMKLVGSDREEGADVFFTMGLIFEKQEQWNKVIDHFNEYLRKYAKVGKADRVFESHVRIGNAYMKKKDDKNALKSFTTAYEAFMKLPDGEKQGLTSGLAAVAEARFQMGEAVFRDFQGIQLKVFPYKNVQKFLEEMGKIIVKKTELITNARRIYMEVIEFRSPNWAIAALARIGQMFQQLANDIYDAPAPGSFDEDQIEVYKGKMAERAAVPEEKAIEAYVFCVKKAQELRWFNEWSDLSEKELARLKPKEYRYPAEVRAKPVHFGEQVVGQDFIVALPVQEEQQ